MDDNKLGDMPDETAVPYLRGRLADTERQLSDLRFQHDNVRAELLANSAVIRMSAWNRILGRVPILRAAQLLWDDCGLERRELVLRTFDDEAARLSYFVHEMIYHRVPMYGRLRYDERHRLVAEHPNVPYGYTHAPGGTSLISKSSVKCGQPAWLEVYVKRHNLRGHLRAMRGIEGKFVEMWAALRREE